MVIFEAIRMYLIGSQVVLHKYHNMIGSIKIDSTDYEINKYVSHGSAIIYVGPEKHFIEDVILKSEKGYDFSLVFTINEQRIEVSACLTDTLET